MDKRIKAIYQEEAAWGTRWLYEKGFSPSGDSGDVSVRDPETGLIYISAALSSIPMPYKNNGDCKAQDMAILDIDGNSYSPWASETIEAPMHLAIYRARPDVQAIVHTHAQWSSVFAIAHMDLPLTLAEHYVNLGGAIRCAEYGPAGSQLIADNVAKALGKNNAVIMANHGAVTVGATMHEAYKNTYFLENICQKVIFAKLLGSVHEVREEDVLDESLK